MWPPVVDKPGRHLGPPVPLSTGAVVVVAGSRGPGHYSLGVAGCREPGSPAVGRHNPELEILHPAAEGNLPENDVIILEGKS